MNPRENETYIRMLELQAVITEQYGVLVKDINDYLWRGDLDKLEKAEKELQGLKSPLLELEAVLSIAKRKRESQKN